MIAKTLRKELETLKSQTQAVFSGCCPHRGRVNLIFETDGNLRTNGLVSCPHCRLPRKVNMVSFLNNDEAELIFIPDEWESTYDQAMKRGVKVYIGVDIDLV